MPTYDYRCESCGYEFERFQSITEDSLKSCPKCEGAVKRLIGAGAGIIFKGSGFYQTDYKSSGPKCGDTSEKKPSACERSDNCPCAE